MAKLTYSAIEFPFIWAKNNIAFLFKYFAPISAFFSLFLVLGFCMTYFKDISENNIWYYASVSIVGLIGILISFWKLILKNFSLYLISYKHLKNESFEISDIDLQTKLRSGKIIKYLLWSALYSVLALIIFYFLPFFILSGVIYSDNTFALILCSCFVLFMILLGVYVSTRLFSFNMPALIIDDIEPRDVFKKSWELLGGKNFFPFFLKSLVIGIIISVVFFLLNLSFLAINFLFGKFFVPYFDIFKDFVFYCLNTFVCSVLFSYFVTSAYTNSKG